MNSIQVYLMKEYSTIVESSEMNQNREHKLAFQMCSIKWKKAILTEAHCKRNEDGAIMRTGHDSWMHEATAMACKIKQANQFC